MSKKVIKYFFELVFIFVIPLLILVINCNYENTIEYDNNGNFQSTEKHIEFTAPFSYVKDPLYTNYLNLNQILHNNVSPFTTTDYWTISSDSTISINNGNIVVDLLNASRVYQTYDLIIGHKYYYKVVIFNYYNYGQFVYNFGTTTSVNISSGQQTLENIVTSTDDHGSIGFYGTIDHTTIAFSYICIIDLTQMYGNGYEPSLADIQSDDLFDNTYEYIDTEILSIASDHIFSKDYIINYTIWGRLKNVFIEGLELQDNFVIDFIISYTILWFNMFIIWHIIYLLFDKLFHLRKE